MEEKRETPEATKKIITTFFDTIKEEENHLTETLSTLEAILLKLMKKPTEEKQQPVGSSPSNN